MQSLNFMILSSKKLHVPNGAESNKRLATALLADVSQLGFLFDKELFDKISRLNKEDIKKLRESLIPELEIMVGSHVDYHPLFAKFPDDVPNDEEYLLRRMVGFVENFFQIDEYHSSTSLSCGHYISNDLFDLDLFNACPICQRQDKSLFKNRSKRKDLDDKINYKILHYISKEGLEQNISNTFLSAVSFSAETKVKLNRLFAELKDDVSKYLPNELSNKENLATITALQVKYTKIPVDFTKFKTMTDVLRLAVGLSSGDVSLKEKSNFSLKSKERKLILSLANQFTNELNEDLLRYKQKYLRLGEYLHVGAYSKKYPYFHKAMINLRTNDKMIKSNSFNSKVHNGALNLKANMSSLDSYLELLKSRPGEFARKLDFTIRHSDDKKLVMKSFGEIVNQVPNTVLLKLLKFFKNRSNKQEFRYFVPKGNISKVWYMDEDKRTVLDEGTKNDVVSLVEKELLNRYSKKKSIKNMYVDPKLKNMLVPFAQRSSSKNLDSLYRGSRVKINDTAKALRLFMYWKENDSSNRIDVDLSASAYNSNFEYLTNLSWTSMKDMDCVHSGDIQSAPEGASEFIDINLQSMKDKGVRYVVVNVFSWTGQKFTNFECFAGVMEREKTSSGEIFEAKTVQNKFDLSGDTTVNIPMIVDLETMELIWADISFDSSVGRRVENSTKTIVQMAKVLLAMKENELNLYELFSLYAKAHRATITEDSSEVVDFSVTEKDAKDVVNILSGWI